jgi:aspartate carbamoyltransferase catalytic subunit
LKQRSRSKKQAMPAKKKAQKTATPAIHTQQIAQPIAASFINPGSLLSVTSLSLEEVQDIFKLADQLEKEPSARLSQRLFKRRVALLFYESSTRTRTSFELAAKALGADTTLVSDKSSSIEKGESLKDTGLTLRALGSECIILRSPYSGAPYLLAETTGLPILNAGDGMHEHPSQALLDLRTILSRLKKTAAITPTTLKGTTLTICGDIFHSRVARSNALLLPRLGTRVILSGPTPLLPEAAASLAPDRASGSIEIERDFNRALQQSQVVMMLRIQAERLAGLSLDLEEYKIRYQANGERVAQYAPKAVIMHPGPMIRGLEISGEVADGLQSAIEEQVHNGVAVRMALIVRALSGEKGKKSR